jgi:hypothetical protein
MWNSYRGWPSTLGKYNKEQLKSECHNGKDLKVMMPAFSNFFNIGNIHSGTVRIAACTN